MNEIKVNIRPIGRRMLGGGVLAGLLVVLTWGVPGVPGVSGVPAAVADGSGDQGTANTEKDPAFDAAVILLKTAVRPTNSKSGLLVSVAVQQLGEPGFRPLYEAMSRSSHPMVVVQGQLGLAQADPQHRLDTDEFMSMRESSVQVETLTQGIEADLVDNDQAGELLAKSDLELPVRLLLATKLIGAGQRVDEAFLKQARESENLAQKSLAALLTAQQGNQSAVAALEEFDQSEDRQRELIRVMLLKAAYRYELDRAGPWALKIAERDNTDPMLAYIALNVALRFEESSAGAIDTWTAMFEKTGDMADKMRLALIAIQAATWTDPRLYEPMLNDDLPLIRKIGNAGQAVATKAPVARPMMELNDEHYVPADQWIIAYCRDHASPQEAQEILTHVINGFSAKQLRSMAIVDLLASAVEVFHQRCPDAAPGLLGPTLQSPQSSSDKKTGILYGLLRRTPAPESVFSTSPTPGIPRTPGTPGNAANISELDSGQGPGLAAYKVVEGLLPLKDPDADRLASLLIAKSDAPLTSQQVSDLGLLVRGGGALPDALRLQAAWAYLKRTGQIEQAVAAALDR